ncbi:MAG: antibiotic biosynthesis monooxygenase [Deltaproteobacteria bacterium]|nr:antibiotic biosynthesis monooxygenase [Deltaproteobacteria bacterium]
MAVKIIIRRIVPEGKTKLLTPLLRKLRELAMNHAGYISGETLRCVNDPREFLVISSWQSEKNWETWLHHPERAEIQEQIDVVIGQKTEYRIYTNT